MKHELKIWPEYFEAVNNGEKTFEVRKNDRNYQVGDILYLREWSPFRESFTGKYTYLKVTYVLRDEEFVKEGYIVMGFHFHYGEVNE
jgi:ASC-1-like (ASCH) protein